MVVPDPMLLTLRSPAKNEFEFSNSLHEFPAANRTSTSSNRYQPIPKQQLSYSPTLEDRKDHRASSSVSDFLSVALAEKPNKMNTPHRGLPPPGQLSLPDPSRPNHPPQPPPAPPPPQSGYGATNLAGLLVPPANWQSNDEMRNWFATKAEEEKRRGEEEKRRAEEERSRQEELRLERRKVEQNMLTESIRNGVPPHLIPFFFLGLGGGLSPEWIQQYLAQIGHSQPQIVPLAQSVSGNSPETGRSVLPAGYAGGHPQQPSQTVPPTPVTAPGAFTFPATARAGNMTDISAGQSRGPFPTTILPRLATGEMHPMHPGAQPSAGAQPVQEQSSPIHFHHWQPPTTASAGTSSAKEQAPATPSEYSSPKKRKAVGTHQPVPAPSRPPDSSANIGNRRTGHARHRSDISVRAMTTDSTSRTPMDRQETPTQQWHHHHHAPPSGPLPPPPSRRYDEQPSGPQGSSEGGAQFDSRRSSHPQTIGSGAQSTPASDDRPSTSEDIEMGER